jgi:hypothetical protein
MRSPRQLSRLLVLLGAFALAASAPQAYAAKQKPAVSKKAKDKQAKTRSDSAKKGWETRRMNQKASANWALRVAKNPSAANKPGAQEAFFKRSLASQRGHQTRLAAGMSAKAPTKAKVSKKTKLRTKKVAKSKKATPKKKQARTGPKKSRPRRGKTDDAAALAAQSPEVAAPEVGQPEAPAGDVGTGEQGMELPSERPGRFGSFARKAGRVALGVGITVAVGAIGFAGGFALAPVIGALTFVGGVPGTAIVGAVMGLGIGAGTTSYFMKDKPARMAQQQMAGGDDNLQGADLLRRYATRRMLENHNLNGAGPGGGLGMFGVGGMSQPGQLGNMINPGQNGPGNN